MNRLMIVLRMIRFGILAVLLGPLTLSAQGGFAPSSAPEFQAIDAYVRGEMASAASPGLAYAIVHGDDIVHMNAFGIADPSGRVVTPQTPFIIGSVGKNFTALAIRQLISAGRVDPNAPVQKYLPWFRVADPQVSATITIQNLLDHKSGIPHWAGIQLYQLDESNTLKDLVRRAETVQPNRAPGTTSEYSNVNFLVLGLIVQQVSGQSYAGYVQQHILAPLEMYHTYFDEREAQASGLATGYQSWYGWFLPNHVAFPPGMAPSGYCISTAEDMGHYLVAYLNDGMYHGTSVLTPGKPAMPKSTQDTYYDIYWNERPLIGDMMEGQSGGTFNYNGDIQIVPGGKWAVVVLMNSRAWLDDLVPTVTAASIAVGVARRVNRWSLPPDAPLTFHQWYLVIDAVLLTIVLFTLYEIVRVWKWYKAIRANGVGSSRSLIVPIVIDLGVACALLALPISQGLALDYFIVAIPDAAIVLCGAAIILIVIVLLRSTLLIAALHQRGNRASSLLTDLGQAVDMQQP